MKLMVITLALALFAPSIANAACVVDNVPSGTLKFWSHATHRDGSADLTLSVGSGCDEDTRIAWDTTSSTGLGGTSVNDIGFCQEATFPVIGEPGQKCKIQAIVYDSNLEPQSITIRFFDSGVSLTGTTSGVLNFRYQLDCCTCQNIMGQVFCGLPFWAYHAFADIDVWIEDTTDDEMVSGSLSDIDTDMDVMN